MSCKLSLEMLIRTKMKMSREQFMNSDYDSLVYNKLTCEEVELLKAVILEEKK